MEVITNFFVFIILFYLSAKGHVLGSLEKAALYKSRKGDFKEFDNNLLSNEVSYSDLSSTSDSSSEERAFIRKTAEHSVDGMHPPVNQLRNKDKPILVYFNAEDKDNALRKKWNSATNLKAAKKCICACKSALKGMCKHFKCEGSERKTFKKDCEGECYERFDADPNDSHDDEDYDEDHDSC